MNTSLPQTLVLFGAHIHMPALSTSLSRALLQVGTSVHFPKDSPSFEHKSCSGRLCCMLVQTSTCRLCTQVFLGLYCKLGQVLTSLRTGLALNTSLPQALLQVSTGVHFPEDSPGFKCKSSSGFAAGWYKRPLPSFEHRSSSDFAADWYKRPLPSFERRSSSGFATG